MTTTTLLLLLLGLLHPAVGLTDQCTQGPPAVCQFEMDSPLRDIKWADTAGTVVFVLNNYRLYRSTNEGKEWTSQMDLLDGSLLGTPNGVREIVPNAGDAAKTKFLFLGRQANNWVTYDSGKTYTARTNQPHFLSVVFHPLVEDWALALRWSQAECAESTFLKDTCHKDLYVTRDFAATWSLVTTYVNDFGWGNAGVADVPLDRIYFVSKITKDGYQKTGWSTDFSFFYTDSMSDKKGVVEAVPFGQAMTAMNEYLFVAALTASSSSSGTDSGKQKKDHNSNSNTDDTDSSSLYSLYCSKSGGKFLRSHLPLGLPESGYTVLDTDLGAVFLSANHGYGSSRWGNVYVSDAAGAQYSLSLPYNSRTADGYVDFEKMHGLEGIYIANVLADASSEEDSAIVTRLSLNNGGSWRPLTAPARDSLGGVIRCDAAEDCHLHLHGMTSAYRSGSSQFTTFYSVASAIGLMLATGNVGSELLTSYGATNTYMSRDAGLSWFEVRKGPHIYEYGDHGGLLVMAALDQSSDRIIYSWNQGNSWEELVIADRPFDIDNVITEPSAKSQKFIVYGTTSTGQGMIVHLDFTGLHERPCEGADAAGTSESDYEWFMPSHGELSADGSSCLLGRETKYLRRKRDHACFNDKQFEAVVFVRNCTCTQDDFECDSGYSADETAEELTCVLQDKAAVVKSPPSPCPAGSTYYTPNGYRLVAGDTCSGGAAEAKYRPETKKCPSSSGSSAVLYSFLVLLFVGVAGVCVVLYRSNPAFASFLSLSGGRSGGGNVGQYFQLNATRPDTVADDDEFALGGDDDDDGPEELHADKIKISPSASAGGGGGGSNSISK